MRDEGFRQAACHAGRRAPCSAVHDRPKRRIYRVGRRTDAYSSKARAYRAKRKLTRQSFAPKDTQAAQDELPLSPEKRAALRRNRARLIRRVYLTDPLQCECGGELRVIAFITERNTIRKILSYVEATRPRSVPKLGRREAAPRRVASSRSKNSPAAPNG